MSGLVVTDLHKSFGDQPVLAGLTLAVPDGSLTAILGPSGSGKTTLLRVVAGFERADRGTVAIGGVVADDLPPERRRIGYVPQEGALFPHLSVTRNIAFGMARSRRRPALVEDLLARVGMAGLGRRYPHELSGGQQQRVALARALAVAPRLVLLDEPFSSLDASLRASVRADVQEILRGAGATALLVTHDQDEALSWADHVAIIRDGRIGQYGTPQGVYARPGDPAVARFLGDANLLAGVAGAGTVRTALGELPCVPGAGEAPGGEAASGGRGGSAGGEGPGEGPGDGVEDPLGGWEDLPAGQEVLVLVRPEQVVLARRPPAGQRTGRVVDYQYFGHDAVVRVRPDPEWAAADGDLLVARVEGGAVWEPGTPVGVTVAGPVTAWPRPAAPAGVATAAACPPGSATPAAGAAGVATAGITPS